MPDNDKLSAALDAMRQRNERYVKSLAFTEATVRQMPSGDLRRTLAALDAVLARHSEWRIYEECDHPREDSVLGDVLERLGRGYVPVDPLTGWWRDGFESGRRAWIWDEKAGRGGVWFREIVESADSDAPQPGREYRTCRCGTALFDATCPKCEHTMGRRPAGTPQP